MPPSPMLPPPPQLHLLSTLAEIIGSPYAELLWCQAAAAIVLGLTRCACVCVFVGLLPSLPPSLPCSDYPVLALDICVELISLVFCGSALLGATALCALFATAPLLLPPLPPSSSQ